MSILCEVEETRHFDGLGGQRLPKHIGRTFQGLLPTYCCQRRPRRLGPSFGASAILGLGVYSHEETEATSGGREGLRFQIQACAQVSKAGGRHCKRWSSKSGRRVSDLPGVLH